MNPPSVSSPRPRKSDCPVGQLSHDTDLPHVLRARDGDKDALTPLWHKYHDNLLDYFDRRIRNAEEAEDLASDTLCAAFSQLASFRGQSGLVDNSEPSPVAGRNQTASCTFRSYLYTIAHNQLAQWIRRKTTRSTTSFSEFDESESAPPGQDSLSDSLPAGPDSDPLRILLSREKDDVAFYALADIGMRSEDQFKAILLHYACDLPHKEIALLLRTPQKTINSRLQEARESMRRRIDSGNEEMSCLLN